ncbi:MAG TPA: site-specific integrase [Bryobacteraceae bacterium]|nr:site-specific integrase [Bryobacteraceae bacterium]
MAVYKRGRVWWYKFTWKGEPIRESTKQTNKRAAEQIEAAHKTSLAKGEVGIREKKPVPTVAQFAANDFLPYVRNRFAAKTTTLDYYEIQVKHLTGNAPLAEAPIDAVTNEVISGFVTKQRNAEYQTSSINRALQVLRRMRRLAVEWGHAEKAVSPISLLPGERRRERVLSGTEEAAYLKAAQTIGDSILERYSLALEGIRATQRGKHPTKPEDPFLLRDVATVLLDCGLRPEECYRLRWDEVRDGACHIPFGKTASARRSIPFPNRVAALLEMRRSVANSEWVFPASTKSGHIGQSSLKRRHAKACALAGLEHLPPYTFRHTCLTRWASHMDPYTLAYFAGHRDFGTTRRYVHPNLESGKAAMERAHAAQGGYKNGHTADSNNLGEGRADSRNLLTTKGLDWYARVDSNHRPFAPEARCHAVSY